MCSGAIKIQGKLYVSNAELKTAHQTLAKGGKEPGYGWAVEGEREGWGLVSLVLLLGESNMYTL